MACHVTDPCGTDCRHHHHPQCPLLPLPTHPLLLEPRATFHHEWSHEWLHQNQKGSEALSMLVNNTSSFPILFSERLGWMTEASGEQHLGQLPPLQDNGRTATGDCTPWILYPLATAFLPLFAQVQGDPLQAYRGFCPLLDTAHWFLTGLYQWGGG